jgi:hypothetical protein
LIVAGKRMDGEKRSVGEEFDIGDLWIYQMAGL